MPKELYDWLTISKQYIRGIEVKNVETGVRTLNFPTHEELCEKYGCSLITIRNISQKEKWYVQRAQFKRKLKIKNAEVNLDDLIGEGTRFDSFHLTALEKVQRLVSSYLDPYVDMLENGYSEIEDLKPITPRDLKEITTIIKDSHQTVRSILGESTMGNLLDDLKEENIANRKNREISKTRLKELSKQLNDAEKLREELEIRKKEIQEQLKLKGTNNSTATE